MGLGVSLRPMSQTTAFHTFGTPETLQTDAAHWIETRLADALARRGEASLICSGGSTPGPVYQQLSELDLDWSRVSVGLADSIIARRCCPCRCGPGITISAPDIQPL